MQVTHFSDPGCPWAWSAGPAFATLHWRYGDQLSWRLVMIGLSETAEEYARRGYTGERQARGYRSFRHRGMPFQAEPRAPIPGTWPRGPPVGPPRLPAPTPPGPAFRRFKARRLTPTRTSRPPTAMPPAL